MIAAIALLANVAVQPADALAAAFKNPPASAKPHTWWHWMDGNVTKEGITADLEAMKQVGLGGAQMFTVSQGIPPGKAGYMSQTWRDMTKHAVQEAGRLGIELCIHNCAGWSSSGGPWIKPEDAMQVIAWSELKVQGPKSLSERLPMPKAPYVVSKVNYYKDIAVYAYRTPEGGDDTRPADFLARTGVTRGDGIRVDLSPKTNSAVIPEEDVVMLTEKLDANGNLSWDVPAGNWTILRMGHIPTGKDNHPAPPEGDGLEVDKLSKEALDHHWAGMMAKVISDVGPLAGKVLNNSLIDSYEVGSQNWTPKFREEFRKLRGYDPLPFLPVIAGKSIEGREKSERFLWDMRRTIADLFAANYFGHFGELCHKAGLKFSTEPYGNGGFDTIQAGSTADIPMGEFWIGGLAMETTKLASSIAHINGRSIVGAESFTADDVRGRWLEEPYGIKALGDLAFANGINRYIFHRYAMQPWLNLKPGMTMGPWGTHLERTQTWWTEAATWLKYVARSQYLLQSGRFVADACYYYGEDAPSDLAYGSALKPALPTGYDYDGCDAGALMSMSVKDGKIVLPTGMSYRMLILPNTTFMTPRIARKIRALVVAGATVYGPKPIQSPSLTNFPDCDDEIKTIADQVWGKEFVQEHAVGSGRVVNDRPLADVLKSLNVAPDFEFTPHNYSTKLVDIHRTIGNAESYFVSNQGYRDVTATCTFRVSGKVPELWHADTGIIEDAPAYREVNGRTSLTLNFGPAESVFIVFRRASTKSHLASFGRVEMPRSGPRLPAIVIDSARYEASDGRGADVTDKVREMVRNEQFEIPATNENFGDPIVNVRKHLVIQYHIGGKSTTQTVDENDVIALLKVAQSKIEPPALKISKVDDHTSNLTVWKPGRYVQIDATGNRKVLEMRSSPLEINLSRNWSLTFPPNLGAPASASFDQLISWPTHANPGIKYFSGTATYAKTFNVSSSFLSGRAVMLDLGAVKNFATIRINGQPVATLWKPPFAIDVSKFVRVGSNRVEVKVTNLWPNRLIGDEQLPPDVEWNGIQLKRWPDWLTKGEPRPKTGRIAFTTWHFYNKESPLLESGLLGPVVLRSAKPTVIRY